MDLDPIHPSRTLAIAYCLRTKLIAIKYFGEAFGAYVYFRNPKGEDVTFYGASDAAFVD